MPSNTRIRPDFLKIPNGVIYSAEDLTARTGDADWEVAVHDGSRTPPEGLYRWDSSSSHWIGKDPDTSGVSI